MKHRSRSIRAALAALGVLTALLAGCGYDETPLPEPPPEVEPSKASALGCDNSDATLESEPPDGTVQPGGKVAEIQERELLRVGVSADTFLMGARDPRTNRIVGFDIEVVKAIGAAIFRDVPGGFNAGRHIQYRVISAAQRIELLQAGELDLVVRNFTINCARKRDIAFSAEYYHSTQKLLLRQDLAVQDENDPDRYHLPADLSDLTVCAPTGTSSYDNFEREGPDATLEPATSHTGCLVMFQRGEVDAITGDDTVLAGLAAQDPYAVVAEEDVVDDESGYGEPYGVGANKDDDDLVAFVNAVLEDMVEDRVWQRAYNRWLEPYLGPGTPPTPAYTS